MVLGLLGPFVESLTDLHDRVKSPLQMETNIEKIEGGRRYSIKLPGFAKEDIKVSLKDGVMLVAASSSSDDEQKEDGKYIIREHASSSCSRAFELNSDVTEHDIHAKYTNGMLVIDVMMDEDEEEPEEEKHIEIS